jgi:protein-S-isoprenylcysteine O-methyltransferase Ste14
MKPSVGWALVGAQFGLLAALVVVPPGDLWQRGAMSLTVSGVLVGVGVVVVLFAGLRLGSSLTPLPIPKDDGELTTGGLYRFVRHPIYSGVLLSALGLVVFGASLTHLLGWFLLFVVLSVKASGEEKMLAQKYPTYENYAKSTGRFVPKLTPA